MSVARSLINTHNTRSSEFTEILPFLFEMLSVLFTDRHGVFALYKEATTVIFFAASASAKRCANI